MKRGSFPKRLFFNKPQIHLFLPTLLLHWPRIQHSVGTDYVRLSNFPTHFGANPCGILPKTSDHHDVRIKQVFPQELPERWCPSPLRIFTRKYPYPNSIDVRQYPAKAPVGSNYGDVESMGRLR